MGKFAGFTSVELRKPQKSMFDLSHERKQSVRMGNLNPVLVMETIPGDSFRGGSEMLVRMAPLLAPIYDRIEIFVHYFFVPNRLVWDEWEEFITGGRLGVGIDPVNAPVPPYLDLGAAIAASSLTWGIGKLPDMLGVSPPLQSGIFSAAEYNGKKLDVLPFAAYQLIWYEYYRDRNFVADDVIALPLASGLQSAGTVADLVELRTRDYMKDYFTSALPFTQRGEEVLMPLDGTGTVTYLTQSRVVAPGGVSASENLITGGAGSDVGLEVASSPDVSARIENIDEVLLTASSVSINDFRSAYALQVWLERNAIGGSRYTESIQAHFAVRPQDSRLQRPEYIGGGRIPVKISEVVSTAWSENEFAEAVPLANMGGHGVTYGNTNRFNYFCTEHGFIIGICSIMARGSYHQGLPRMFFKRRSFLDYPWPTFAKLGEQQIASAEIYVEPDAITEDSAGEFPLFGYTSRYADWKFIPSTCHGDFHTTLLFWSLVRNFEDGPVLGSQFLAWDDTTSQRIFAVQQDFDNFWLYIHNQVSVVRALPYFGAPNTLGFS